MSWENILKSKGPSVDKLKSYAKTIYHWREWYEDKRGRKVKKNYIIREDLLTEPIAKKALEVLDRVTFTHDQKYREGNVVEMFGEYIITARWSSYSSSHPLLGKHHKGEGTSFYCGLTVIRTFPGKEPHAVRLEMEIPHAKEIDELSDEEIDAYSWMVDWREGLK
tara:strand:+ start:25 stop:519 length:495 start_codon:yes stop_codon:yes gene_type:complete